MDCASKISSCQRVVMIPARSRRQPSKFFQRVPQRQWRAAPAEWSKTAQRMQCLKRSRRVPPLVCHCPRLAGGTSKGRSKKEILRSRIIAGGLKLTGCRGHSRIAVVERAGKNLAGRWRLGAWIIGTRGMTKFSMRNPSLFPSKVKEMRPL